MKSKMEEYISVFESKKKYLKKKLNEQINFLNMYKVGDEDINALIENFIKKFNAPRTEIYKSLAKLLTVMAEEYDIAQKEKEKKMGSLSK